MTGCIITGNFAQAFGGGVYNQATATITDCTISGNTVELNGGGLVTGVSATSTLTACTISGNTAHGRRRPGELLPDDADELHDQRQHGRHLTAAE